MKKVLVISNLGRHFRFFGQYDYKVLLDLGFDVHIAANFEEKIDNFDDTRVIKHQIDFKRNPFNYRNLYAYFQLKKLFNSHFFQIIQTQSPSGGFYSRLAAVSTRRKGSKVIYTAHGFHFYKGAHIVNWFTFFVIEKLLGYFTDCLITINKEDYLTANRFKLARNVRFIPGVGINLSKFQNKQQKDLIRTKYNYNINDFILISVAELNNNKNQEMLINVILRLKEKINNIVLILVGNGKNYEKYFKLIKKYELEDNVKLLGQRNDIPELLSLSDIFVTASRREGLPVSVMEAMAVGLPIVATNCRGNIDLVINNENGYVVNIDDVSSFAEKIETLYSNKELINLFASKSIELIKKFDIKNVSQEMKSIYKQYT